MSIDSIPGLLPGEVESYDPVARTCRVRIPGITDGSSILPEAIIMSPIGDRSDAANSKDHTELRILPNDAVWLMFEAGDPRFPIIVGARLKRAGNPTGWRRWRHANIEMTADGVMRLNANKLEINVTTDMVTVVGGNQSDTVTGNQTSTVTGNQNDTVSGNQTTNVTGTMSSQAASSTHQAATHQLTAQTQINGALTTGSGPGGTGASIAGPVAITGGTVTHDGKNIGKTHTHNENNVVGGPTNAPN